MFKHQPICPDSGHSADTGPWLSRGAGRGFLFDVTSANDASQSKTNMKARGTSQIFALRLILMFVRVDSDFQVHSELALTGHK